MDPKFLAANRLGWGDKVKILVDGKEVSFTVVGAAISPEFIYAMKDNADILPDPRKFGIFYLENKELQQILNMSEQINQVLIEFDQGVDHSEVISDIKDILKPYGLLASYPREDQLSHAITKGELDQLRSVTRVLPLIFFGIATAIQFVILRRMIKSQRSQIGLMKGLGYDNYRIMLHYVFYALAVSLSGAVIGLILGIFSSAGISEIYSGYFNFPGGIHSYNLEVIFYGFIMCLSVGVIAGISSSYGVMEVQPAEAMRPEPPKAGGKSFLEYLPWLWVRINSGWKMTFRNISRNKGRFAVTLMGVIFAVGLLVISLFTNDAVDYMMEKFFYKGQSYDIAVRFDSVISEKALLDINRIEGVQRAEGFLELPVRIYYRGKNESEVILAYNPETTMKSLDDGEGNPVKIPEAGMLINQRTAKKLGIKAGVEVEVETLLPTGPIHREKVFIVGENRQLVGSGSYMDLKQANILLRERNAVSGVLLKIENGKEIQIETEINKMPKVSSVISHQKEVENFEKNLEAMDFSILIMVLFASLLGYAIVYNSSVMNLAERNREIGCMRVMGFSLAEISGLLIKENIIQASIGIVLGLFFGRITAQAYIQSISTDLYTLPVIIYPRTYIMAAVIGVVFILAAHFLSIRGIRNMELSEALKSPE
ncbi:MAG: FtsX-like permease family protein [Peptococcaceae bacterium]|nr:FtsX-like permease family protein [Peptococcaceae bacterium]